MKIVDGEAGRLIRVRGRTLIRRGDARTGPAPKGDRSCSRRAEVMLSAETGNALGGAGRGKRKAPGFHGLRNPGAFPERSRRDLNPRGAMHPYLLSREAHSTGLCDDSSAVNSTARAPIVQRRGRLAPKRRVAEGEGFEPPVLSHNGFQDRHHRPLGHLSVSAALV